MNLLLAKAARDVLTSYLEGAQYRGICGVLSEKLGSHKYKELLPWLLKQFMRWPKFSGQMHYPVPHPIASADDAYDRCDHYTESTEYGDNRRELVNFLIDKLDAEVEEIEQRDTSPV